MNAQDEKFMRSALKLAERGLGSVEPNPAVGCVIVKAGQVIGKGYHKKFGGPHAEVNAIADCATLGVRPDGATMYVTLEPCCHVGKTGPCTQAILDARIARVVVAVGDPSAHACGKGLTQLRQAGIKVEVGLCEQEARLLNAPFFKFASTGKCWVVLKWAQSIDGKLAYSDSSVERRWITNELSRADAHRLRRRSGAVLVGINTVLADNPMLTPRPSKGKKPIRIVLDDALRIPLKSRLLRTAKTGPVLVVTRRAAVEDNPKHAERIRKRGAEILVCEGPGEITDLQGLLDQLSSRGIQQVLVEGGPRVLASFLREGLADEICVYIAPKILGADGTAFIGQPMSDLMQGIGLDHVQIRTFGDDVCLRGLLADPSIQQSPSADRAANVQS
ncbi:MAG TPA: bifunctional diaminohydroxyphosphoribosylaminopyrimidine deaminase/5-amino-6-(5-phosphoribosylamino)uracil reductase RibD [Sedimentisphaerales bacterium]|nr:bifunctional diaminohydroxyphosphoribosylaminopyrimidine deaminase/5-amino-6-(5-phosphoribosylamino)uracil reductase RibD [Phycisphaerae bacterium]HON92876.1 bifunctional diaminohydroxyphosphoribosylaminopyrimidine deaminase/5-amino-6-(5-phosphoribosylamino)uracil reductase RibD [Sedimentisphaerales bacterium]HQI28680.1 bifunctional diaminohydroxyphosphoribosylaminopyrimidine deaminase/5-amino-6-(5-phosphoribosylamino)uracil reductase RibD [Sedimentisphaerales bacterium]